MSAREAARLGCVLLIGMAVAFPAGLMLAGGGDDKPAGRAGSATMREVYSPEILDDPWFVEQQRANIEALERTCRETGEMCGEAREARRWLESRD